MLHGGSNRLQALVYIKKDILDNHKTPIPLLER